MAKFRRLLFDMEVCCFGIKIALILRTLIQHKLQEMSETLCVRALLVHLALEGQFHCDPSMVGQTEYCKANKYSDENRLQL